MQSQGLSAPAYWLAPGDPRAPSDQWQIFGLHGVQPLDRNAPVTHIGFYEAVAFAEWAGARLPTEFEWELAFDAPGITQMLGQAWQWTRSSYDPYPGFKPRNWHPLSHWNLVPVPIFSFRPLRPKQSVLRMGLSRKAPFDVEIIAKADKEHPLAALRDAVIGSVQHPGYDAIVEVRAHA